MTQPDSADAIPMRSRAPSSPEDDAAGFARWHAGAREPDLSAAQRDLLGRIIASRLARGAKLETIARAAAGALPELGAERAGQLARDEALRALAHERLAALRAEGATLVTLSPATGACPACRAAAGVFALDALPAIPVAGCVHPDGCRCVYAPPAEGEPRGLVETPLSAALAESPPTTTDAATDIVSERPWYRPRPPRPHGPRWARDEATGVAVPPPRPARQPRRPAGPRKPDR